MRRLWITFMTVAMMLVIALPATAKKPDRPKPPSAVPIAVGIDDGPMWVHEGDDLIIYTVTLENKTSDDYTGVVVKFTTTNFTKYDDAWVFPDNLEDGVVPANSSVWLNFYRSVDQFEEAGPCLATDSDSWPDECALLATAAVLIDGVPLTQTTTSTPLMPYPACDFTYDGDQSSDVTVSDLCIWTPPKTGVWKITLTPTAPDNPNRPINAVVAVRDGVPGNWCTLIDDNSTFTGKWKDGDSDVFGWVYLPGAENGPTLDDGMCLHGGAGGDYFQVGNPDSFYLRASGTVTTEWVSATPSSR